MSRQVATLLLALFILALGYEFRGLWKDYRVFDKKFASLSTTVAALEKENGEIENKLRYYSIEENLLKELKARFNYRFPDEKLIIVAPE